MKECDDHSLKVVGEELTFPDDNNLYEPADESQNVRIECEMSEITSEKRSINEKIVEEMSEKFRNELKVSEKVSDKSELSDNLSDKSVLKDKIAKELSDKPKMSDRLSDILSDIFVMACSNDFITTSAVAAELSLDARSVRRYITRLVDYGYLVAEGGNKNKKYRRANN